MKHLFESLRQDAIRQLEQEEQNRTAKLRELHQAIAELEAKQEPFVNRLLRAQRPLTDTSVCPRCWIWDGERNPLAALTHEESDGFDLFRCIKCGQEIEAPID